LTVESECYSTKTHIKINTSTFNMNKHTQVFIDEMNRTTRGNAQNPWLVLESEMVAMASDKRVKLQKHVQTSAGDAKAATRQLVESVSDKKSILLQLRKVGYDAGVTITRKAMGKDGVANTDKNVYTILRIDDDGAVMGAEGAEQVCVKLDDLMDLFNKTSRAVQKKVVWDESADASKHVGWEAECVKAAVIMALRRVMIEHDTGNTDNIELFETPTAAVAKIDFAAKSLVLVPAGMAVALRTPTHEDVESHLDIHVPGGRIARIKRRVTEDFMAPFWFVTRAASDEEANMVMIATKKVSVVIDKKTVADIIVPMCRNRKKIRVGDKLMLPPLEEDRVDGGIFQSTDAISGVSYIICRPIEFHIRSRYRYRECIQQGARNLAIVGCAIVGSYLSIVYLHLGLALVYYLSRVYVRMKRRMTKMQCQARNPMQRGSDNEFVCRLRTRALRVRRMTCTCNVSVDHRSK